MKARCCPPHSLPSPPTRTDLKSRAPPTALRVRPRSGTHLLRTHVTSHNVAPPHQSDSRFAAAYSSGLHKSKYWDPVYEDSMNLIARLPQLAAIIYRRTYRQRDYIPPSPTLDWAANLSHMMGACSRRQRGWACVRISGSLIG